MWLQCQKIRPLLATSRQSGTSSALVYRRFKSSSPLHGDEGNLATHMHHHMTTALALATPLLLFVPDNGILSKVWGLGVAGYISGHSWIGLNYVVTDYVPKVSKAMVGPARIVCAGLGLVTFVGLGKVALNDHGGIQGAIKGLWIKKEQTTENQDDSK
mmetsp:Transcript_12209/g.11774  ORF Transcript_12209/g.11774 Transcript_12209/m.11774 type:complete len:158 (-) Transcript_12209:142-615(-)|eukprot:CAMPEP_0197825304 /NCGR_PEP_ID=MMETSP1437-20131217/2401_1 /TAXON_ID=49252 ORGANISM="Eucampia antarctica, Strain CCMP1452" /NCGR_SAMPLE_ID=MMETSP1437 /ASSEMBLY_ACC=CAM_ASM_001096 /LENGTH=157 /DNA_ID=CAMNT_0043425235 /DNA_START=91 /DNA_END=564 /DNA_ORIENTATION=-